MKKLTETFNSMTVKKGEEFTIDLETNPSTGYSWDVAVTSGQARKISQDFTKPATAMGSSIRDIQTYKSDQVGDVEIIARYKNFMGSVSKTVTFKVTVQ